MQIVKSGIEIAGNELDGLRSCVCACSGGYNVAQPEEDGSLHNDCACGCAGGVRKTSQTFKDALLYPIP